METRILPVDATRLGKISATPSSNDILDELHIDLDPKSVDARHLTEAAKKLKSSDVPVAFPTETVYGLGADATRSAAVKGIYKAKQRPSDNPLIVHFASLKQLRNLLDTRGSINGSEGSIYEDPIPEIYRPLISRFWPGPLTILLRNPPNSPLAPEVTAGLQTFGARVPRHTLALALIQTANVPVAAPSANASTKPSPTAAEHVAYDLDGRIEIILDGGPCDVGVESTVVDGLSEPPLVLRPGGISIEQIRACAGWEKTQVGYQNTSESGSQPKAPGMKYRHYSPNATVVLFEPGQDVPSLAGLRDQVGNWSKIGVIRTKSWEIDPSRKQPIFREQESRSQHRHTNGAHATSATGFAGMLHSMHASNRAKSAIETHSINIDGSQLQVVDINLGPDTADIARGIFSALRDLDRQNVDVICVEGIDDNEGDTAAALMNRLRKAAEVRLLKGPDKIRREIRGSGDGFAYPSNHSISRTQLFGYDMDFHDVTGTATPTFLHAHSIWQHCISLGSVGQIELLGNPSLNEVVGSKQDRGRDDSMGSISEHEDNKGDLTILVTGFGPFQEKFPVNPSYEITKLLPDYLPAAPKHPRGVRIICYPSPIRVVFNEVRELVPKLHDAYAGTVDLVLHIGMASGRKFYCAERYGHRDGYSKNKDIEGKVPPPDEGQTLFGDCPAFMKTSLDFESIVSNWQNQIANIPEGEPGALADVRPSEDAGNYLCAYIYFNSLAYFGRRSGDMEGGKDTSRPVLFLHVPAQSEEADLKKGRAITVALIRAMADSYNAGTGA